MSRNDKGEQFRVLLGELQAWLPNQKSRVSSSVLQKFLDEALATERRLTVERVRKALSWETVDEFGPEAVIRASLLDDLATADVDKEAGDATNA